MLPTWLVRIDQALHAILDAIIWALRVPVVVAAQLLLLVLG